MHGIGAALADGVEQRGSVQVALGQRRLAEANRDVGVLDVQRLRVVRIESL